MGFASKLSNFRKQKCQYEVTVEITVQNKKTSVKTVVSARSKKEALALAVHKVKTQTKLAAVSCYNLGKIDKVLKS